MPTFGELERAGVKLTTAELDALPCECPREPVPRSPRCGRGWIRCRRKCAAWLREAKRRLAVSEGA